MAGLPRQEEDIPAAPRDRDGNVDCAAAAKALLRCRGEDCVEACGINKGVRRLDRGSRRQCPRPAEELPQQDRARDAIAGEGRKHRLQPARHRPIGVKRDRMIGRRVSTPQPGRRQCRHRSCTPDLGQLERKPAAERVACEVCGLNPKAVEESSDCPRQRARRRRLGRGRRRPSVAGKIESDDLHVRFKPRPYRIPDAEAASQAVHQHKRRALATAFKSKVRRRHVVHFLGIEGIQTSVRAAPAQPSRMGGRTQDEISRPGVTTSGAFGRILGACSFTVSGF